MCFKLFWHYTNSRFNSLLTTYALYLNLKGARQRHQQEATDMYGLAAIHQANGWAMAGAGAGIVLLGLAVLSFLISMIPRLTGFFEKKAHPPNQPAIPEILNTPLIPERMPEDIDAASTIYVSLTEELGEAFTLIELHRKAKELGLPHPHLSINRFRDAGRLVSLGEGRFSWQPISE
mgnify:CR=1 FL=1